MINNELDISEYRKLCVHEASIPLFSKDWWLDAVAPNEWDAKVYKKKNGDIIGAFVYHYKITDEGKIIDRAPISQNNGIWMNKKLFSNVYSYRKYEESIMDSIISEINEMKLISYSQQFHHSITNWLPFFWNYYQCAVRYTYIIDTSSDIDTIFNGFSSNNRNCVRKAQKLVKVDDSLNAEEFYNLNKMTFARQGLEIPYSYDLFMRVEKACSQRDCRKILAAYDQERNLHAAIYLVWDESSVYYLFSASDPQFRNSQANSFLIYEGIKFAKSINRSFDFEGSVIKRVEKNIRQFGGIQQPYFKIFKQFK